MDETLKRESLGDEAIEAYQEMIQKISREKREILERKEEHEHEYNSR